MKTVYLDNNATTRVAPESRRPPPYFGDISGNSGMRFGGRSPTLRGPGQAAR